MRYFPPKAAAAACPEVPFPYHVSTALRRAFIKAARSFTWVNFASSLRSDNSAPLVAHGSMMPPFLMMSPVHEAVQPSTTVPSGLSAPPSIRCRRQGALRVSRPVY
ncbi:hypothetical protein Y032_0387g469 [Ancylostoma ceylanicum]|uniref:Uncharacterized protein n=1 Tax=Ancylostoma ceylanicum TaxID=53326 RepID=A0A016RTJ0_9BILA|nr:hypothetical protein Y032_0387g469 [Ancylostoma ceylanicum]